MRKVKVKELTLENFSKYGTFVNMINPDAVKFGNPPVEFFRDMAQLDLGGSTKASFSICRVENREPVVNVTECHSYCGEANISLDGDILFHAGIASPNGVVPSDSIEVFRVPKGTLVIIRPGVWHHAPFVCDGSAANVIVVLPERTYANDCKVIRLEEEIQVEL